MIASVIGIDDTISVTPTLDTNAYASGDRLGSIQTITGAFRQTYRPFDQPQQTLNSTSIIQVGGKVILSEVTIIDQAKQSAAIDILFFNALPTVASADNAPIDITDAEMIAKCVGGVSISTSYIALANNSMVSQPNINIQMKQSATAANYNLYAVCIIRASATYAADSLVFRYKFYQD